MEKKTEDTKGKITIDEAEMPARKLMAKLTDAGAPEGLMAGFVAESEALYWCYLTAHAVTNRLLDEGIIEKMDASKIEGQLCQLIYMKMQVSVQAAAPQVVQPSPVVLLNPGDPVPGSRR